MSSHRSSIMKLRAACNSCHLAKIRCSGGQPCSSCQLSNHVCHYSPRSKLGRPKGSKNRPKTRVAADWAEAPDFSAVEIASPTSSTEEAIDDDFNTLFNQVGAMTRMGTKLILRSLCYQANIPCMTVDMPQQSLRLRRPNQCYLTRRCSSLRLQIAHAFSSWRT